MTVYLSRKDFLERVQDGKSRDSVWYRRLQWWAQEGLVSTNPEHSRGEKGRPKIPVYDLEDVPLVAVLFPVADLSGWAAMHYARAIKVWLEDDEIFRGGWYSAQRLQFSPSLALRLGPPEDCPLYYRFAFTSDPIADEPVAFWQINLTATFFGLREASPGS